ncbi:MAG: translation initiation factor IF-3 [Pseudomonadota bacterium]
MSTGRSNFRGGRERGLRINRQIRVPEVRLIGAEGEQLGVFITSEAFRRAEDLGLDLVEICPTSRPPVCKIIDYGKYKYEQDKKKHEQKKHQVVVKLKEIKLRPVTDEHDFQTKLKHVRRFLEEGDKVKITMRFRGREMAHLEIGRKLMDELKQRVQDICKIEQDAKVEGRQMFMLLVPLKSPKK